MCVLADTQEQRIIGTQEARRFSLAAMMIHLEMRAHSRPAGEMKKTEAVKRFCEQKTDIRFMVRLEGVQALLGDLFFPFLLL